MAENYIVYLMGYNAFGRLVYIDLHYVNLAPKGLFALNEYG